MFRVQNYYFFVNIQKISITFCLMKRQIITYLNIRTYFIFHSERLSTNIYFKITHRKKNKIKAFFIIGLHGIIGRAFLLYGLRTEFKRKATYVVEAT